MNVNAEELLSRIAAEDRQAFQQFYQLFAEKVFNTALSYTQNFQDAEEVTQDVFISIYQAAANFKAKAAVNTWVYRITVNKSINFIKKKKRWALFHLNYTPKEQTDFEHPALILENKENAKLLFQFIASLANKQKTAFILSFVEDLPRQEVADIMGLSLKAVESLLQRAKKNLRSKLEKSYPNRRI